MEGVSWAGLQRKYMNGVEHVTTKVTIFVACGLTLLVKYEKYGTLFIHLWIHSKPNANN